jgi:hypothetical protein
MVAAPDSMIDGGPRSLQQLQPGLSLDPDGAGAACSPSRDNNHANLDRRFSEHPVLRPMNPAVTDHAPDCPPRADTRLAFICKTPGTIGIVCRNGRSACEKGCACPNRTVRATSTPAAQATISFCRARWVLKIDAGPAREIIAIVICACNTCPGPQHERRRADLR